MQQCTSRSSERCPAAPKAAVSACPPKAADAGGGESRNADSMRDSGMGGSRSSCLRRKHHNHVRTRLMISGTMRRPHASDDTGWLQQRPVFRISVWHSQSQHLRSLRPKPHGAPTCASGRSPTRARGASEGQEPL